jgi:hypothetical protein
MKLKLLLAAFALTLFGNVVLADPPIDACPVLCCCSNGSGSN